MMTLSTYTRTWLACAAVMFLPATMFVILRTAYHFRSRRKALQIQRNVVK